MFILKKPMFIDVFHNPGRACGQRWHRQLQRCVLEGVGRAVCLQVPPTAPYVVVVMGTVIDYFQPTGEGVSWCDMLTSNTKQ